MTILARANGAVAVPEEARALRTCFGNETTGVRDGRAAEELVFREPTTGVSSTSSSTRARRSMVTEFE